MVSSRGGQLGGIDIGRCGAPGVADHRVRQPDFPGHLAPVLVSIFYWARQTAGLDQPTHSPRWPPSILSGLSSTAESSSRRNSPPTGRVFIRSWACLGGGSSSASSRTDTRTCAPGRPAAAGAVAPPPVPCFRPQTAVSSSACTISVDASGGASSFFASGTLPGRQPFRTQGRNTVFGLSMPTHRHHPSRTRSRSAGRPFPNRTDLACSPHSSRPRVLGRYGSSPRP